MRAVRAIYQGKIDIVQSDSVAAAFFTGQSMAVPKSIEVHVEFIVSEDKKLERVVYAIDEAKFVLSREDEAFAEITPAPAKIRYRPLEESTGYTGLGFLLPPGRSRLFSSFGKGEAIGDRCDAGDGRCQDVKLMMSFGAGTQTARLIGSDKLVSSADGRPLAEWIFGRERDGFPEQISYREHPLSDTVVASAHYKLMSVRAEAGWKPIRELVPKDALSETTIQGRGFGTAYDPNTRDVWANYRQQQRVRQKSEEQRSIPWPVIGGGLLVLAIISLIAIQRSKGR